LVVLATLLLAACGGDETATPDPQASASETAASENTTAVLTDPDGEEVGTVEISFSEAGATVIVEARGLTPGFHGFHLHETGLCEPDSASPSGPAMTGDFLSAGGHLAESGEDHGEHLGDLPALLASAEGTALLNAESALLTADAVLDDDGSAVMIHADPDNLGNIPERYAPTGPDEMTTDTGDSGGRVACAVVEAG
jgi:Cu-Zn family superoxide dismutase